MPHKIRTTIIASSVALGALAVSAAPAAAVTQYFSPAYSTASQCIAAQNKHPNIFAKCFFYSVDKKYHFTFTLHGYM
jgi:hypothetical protein